ncbi:MAG TPA: PaaI family thioesterase [Candidatus Acidoferrales bacterium]|nr:PaaI family thioesterase [Candidatus Acidoferrales bacterium]
MSHRNAGFQRVAKFLARVPFNMLVGLQLTRLHRDGITLECPIRRELRNSAGAAHGGVAATMADAAVGIALQRHFGGKRPITTVELKVNYFRPITQGRLIARSHLLRIGSRLSVGSVDLTDERSRPVGTAIVTYMVVSPPHATGYPRAARRPSPRTR